MTPREWGKLQGFIGYAFVVNGEDTFTFPDGISDCQKYKQFGNSVTIPVIKTMAEFMTECFDILGEELI
jgi:DNA (cytosine-5)-methyltransferase 1